MNSDSTALIGSSKSTSSQSQLLLRSVSGVPTRHLGFQGSRRSQTLLTDLPGRTVTGKGGPVTQTTLATHSRGSVQLYEAGSFMSRGESAGQGRLVLQQAVRTYPGKVEVVPGLRAVAKV